MQNVPLLAGGAPVHGPDVVLLASFDGSVEAAGLLVVETVDAVAGLAADLGAVRVAALEAVLRGADEEERHQKNELLHDVRIKVIYMEVEIC